MLKGKTVLLGVTGSIAAYKIAGLASMLKKQHADITVLMTQNATNFINPITFETLTGNKCLIDTFDRNFQYSVEHVALAKRADIVLIAPASANVIGKIANGIADDMLTTTVMACRCPILISPAMNTNMFLNPIVQDNLAKLRRFGYTVIEPDSGYLACGDIGAGKMPSEKTLFDWIMQTIGAEKDLAGQKILVTAGATAEKIDPVRFITNHSTGKMGCALARRAAMRGADADAAINTLKSVPVSLHCWQGDDVRGFDGDPNAPLTGGIQTTGNYPGRARTPEELMADIDEVLRLCPGTKKLNLHASYAIFTEENGGWVDRDKLEPKHFAPWVKFCKERGLGCDFNPTYFSHPKCDPLTLSSPNPETRKFWVEHGKACIRISQYLAEELGQPCIMNIWTGDGLKDIPADRMTPRMLYKESLDEILSEPFDFNLVKPCVESKVFGIGVEAYTVGSAEFALSYAAMNKDKCIPLLDNGHYHPTEVVSDKIPAMLTFFPEIALHITRGVRWDSDHVVLFDDETKEIAKEIVRCGGLSGRVKIALDYFDASINRIGAWVTGFRNVQKALLFALLQPTEELTKLQNEQDFTSLMIRAEELKTMPFGDVWAEYCKEQNVPADDMAWLSEIKKYENEVLLKR